MTDLTEQWKKGELPSGWYWVEGCRDKEIYAYTSEYLNHMYRPKNSDRIIEQVPSYKEWLEKTKSLKVLAEAYCKEKQKNDEIKELLKECRYEINPSYIEVIGGTKTFKNLIDKINEVLR